MSSANERAETLHNAYRVALLKLRDAKAEELRLRRPLAEALAEEYFETRPAGSIGWSDSEQGKQMVIAGELAGLEVRSWPASRRGQ